MIATTIDVMDPTMNYFLTQAAVEEFRGQQLATNVMQLIGIFKGFGLNQVHFNLLILFQR